MGDRNTEVGLPTEERTSLETVRVLHQTVVSLRSALEKSRNELHSLREQVKNSVDPKAYNRTIENLTIENHVLRQKVLSMEEVNKGNMEDKVDSDSSVDDVFEDEKPEVNGLVVEKKELNKSASNDDGDTPRISKGDSEESEEVDDIELIFTTDDTKELGAVHEDLVSIAETDGWKHREEDIAPNLKQTWSHSVLVETDISKCGIIDENDPPNQNTRRNTLPSPLPYRPIIHRDVLSGSKGHIETKPVVKFSPSERNARSVRPILVEKNTIKQESEAQTDITALPVQWRSESYLAHHKVSQQFTTLPSKFTLPFGQIRKQSLKLSEKTQEARRVLLSDINFTSMVPELSRSADHLCQDVQGSLLCKYPRAFSYMKNPDMSSPAYLKGAWSPCECSHRRPSWDYYHGSSMSIPPSASDLSESRRRHSMRPSLSSLDTYWVGPSSRPTWASMPSSPTHCQRSRSVPLSSSYVRTCQNDNNTCCNINSCRSQIRLPSQRSIRSAQPRHKVKFLESKVGRSYPGQSLPDLRIRTDAESGEDSTDSLIDESEDYLRRSIDSILTGEVPLCTRRRRARSHSQPDHTFIQGCRPPKKAYPFLARAPSDLRIDHWVKVIIGDGKLGVGRVRYVGPLPDNQEIHVGIQMAPGEGNTNGTYASTRFFDCDADCGMFIPFKKVVMAWSA
ncbi:hypothetical protein O3M35_009567 [Rhynocoris fuscipes]|uniref:CAP-Gly domain-containing protein n=1 Tax=Rhynocoris fuscipes TaxID=488301 RepID=A0AAW1D704_9HEMI